MKIYITCLIIFILSYFSFTTNITCFCTTDAIPNNLTAFNLIFNRRIDLTNLYPEILKLDLKNITVTNNQGVVFSKTPPILGILSVPTFAAINTFYGVNTLTPIQMVFSNYGQYLGKISASFYTSLASVLLFLLLMRLFSNYKASLLGTEVFVYGTNVFNTVSQANWQHGISLFILLIFLHLVISKNTKMWQIILAGLLISLATLVRISNGIYFLLPWLLRTKPKLLIIYFLTFIGGYLSLFILNTKLGIPSAYQSEIIYSLTHFSLVTIFVNLFSILFSWNFGLFIFCPILLLALLGYKKDSLYISLGLVAVLFLLFNASWTYWTGGTSLEARMLSESLPIWIIFLTHGFIKFSKSKIYLGLFIILFSLSVFINLLTTWVMDASWFPYYTKQTPQTQVQDAWYAKPTLLGFLLSRKVVHWETLYKDGSRLMIHRIEFRFDLPSKSFKVYENKRFAILDIL